MKYRHILISTPKPIILMISTQWPDMDIMKEIVILRWRLIFVTSTWRIDLHPMKEPPPVVK